MAPPPRGKAPPPPPKLTLKDRFEKLARSGYVDQNDAANFIKDSKGEKPDRVVLRELKNMLIKHQGVFDRAAFHKLKTFFETYKAENDVD
jgi:hypothetical protein